MRGTVPWRANCDALQQIRSKIRRENPKRPPKHSYCCNTIERLAVTNEAWDCYSYYHATKGWRNRRIGSKTDRELYKALYQ